MGIMVYSLVWVMQDFVHQPYHCFFPVGYRRALPGFPRPILALDLGVEASCGSLEGFL